METALQVLRPGYNQSGTPIQLLGNFFVFNPKDISFILQRYSVSFIPEISSSLSKLRTKIIFVSKPQIIEHIGKFVFANTILFSLQTSPEFFIETLYDSVNYTLKITPTGALTQSNEIKHFYNKFFNRVQGMLKLVMIGRKFYDPNRPIKLSQHKLVIWPGYANSVGYYEGGCLLNVDVSHRCLREVTVYDQIKEVEKKNPHNCKQAISRLLIGASVLTMYNKRTYKIDEIDWDMSPSSTFEKNGEKLDFRKYYSTHWGKEIRFNDQPLLRSNLKNITCYLIPEFCVITGLTDEIRNDFMIMKDLTQATSKDPKARLTESAGLIRTLTGTSKIYDEMNDWHVSINANPISISARVIPAGRVIMGNNESFHINEAIGSFDRDVQKKMFSQPRIDKWGVFYVEFDKKLVEQNLLSNLHQSIKTFNVACEKPAQFSIASDRWEDWDRILRQTLNPGVKIIICVLPGFKGKSRLYDDLKRLTFSSFPVPTQVILNSTLKKEKSLRSVINKIVIQINAKIGGTPWVIDPLPLADTVSMVIGIDLFIKTGSYGVLGFCATVDRNYSKYCSFPSVINPGEEFFGKIKESTQLAIKQFYNENQDYPRIIVVFRDGVSDSQRSSVINNEVEAIKQAFAWIKTENKNFISPSLLYVTVNKRTNARFYFQNNGNITNPPIGTVVDSKVVDKFGYDFFILPAKSAQGCMIPTHFHVVYDDSGLSCDNIQSLAYKMCFSYFNWSGSVRVPAPCLYAHKLAYSYGERSDQNGPPQPHPHWTTSRSLYYL
ncbi:hypothetical protein SteCoe_15480 [Stentor coeruleus]|uniref:Piwi-like protein 08 n=1 Tax=Stentor coeruleus TaxID=5963 RepID=A0A060BG42_9CILI|nr:piwi-like protein 08 [Stentor coeruleus]OMJ83571.1 hypothetical protein SteCoe_15480 [Stentor coeruleus]